ncbi:MAG: hypothetical protein MZU95_00295 [Desulfomicrobium escambiense]|nr:hypothetical protein [Desulfomicrobium escambiense]
MTAAKGQGVHRAAQGHRGLRKGARLRHRRRPGAWRPSCLPTACCPTWPRTSSAFSSTPGPPAGCRASKASSRPRSRRWPCWAAV